MSLGEEIRDDINNVVMGYLNNENNPNTRMNIGTDLMLMMESYKSNKTISTYEVICDVTNNPPSVIDDNKIRINVIYFATHKVDGTELRVTVQLNDQFQTAFDRAMKGI